MKILIKRDAVYDQDFKDMNFELESVLETNDEADATEVTYMFLKAMEIEGYYKGSILNAMYNVALAEAEQWDIELKDEEEEYYGKDSSCYCQ